MFWVKSACPITLNANVEQLMKVIKKYCLTQIFQAAIDVWRYSSIRVVTGVWSLRVGSSKWDSLLVLAFVGQTRFVVFSIKTILD